MKYCKYYSTLVLFGCMMGTARSQTFFETAKDDGIISFSQIKGLSQLKVSPTSTGASFGYYYNTVKSTRSVGTVGNIEVKVKANDDGLAALAKGGNLQPGFKVSSAIGFRLNDIFKNSGFFTVFDFYLKPAYSLDGLSIFDTTRSANGQDAFYKTNKGSFALNGLINGLLSPGPFNIYFGVQFGPNWTNNSGDLDDVTIQDVLPYPGSSTQAVFANQKDAKMGTLNNVTKWPLAGDLIFDPNIALTAKDPANGVRLGFFGYHRSDGHEKKYREGFGICFLNLRDPSKIMSSIGYELPTHGSDVKPDDRQKDKGMFFFTIGYSIK